MLLTHVGHVHLPEATSFWDFIRWWDLSPTTVIPLAIIGGAYLLGRWKLATRSQYSVVTFGRSLLFAAGFGVLVLALVSPVDVYGGELFFMHMVQHLTLLMLAVPLLMLASPMSVFLWALPAGLRHGLGRTLNRSGLLRRLLRGATVPVVAWLVYTGNIWLWHTPLAYNAALESEGLHSLEHLAMFGAAVLFWWPVIGPAPIRSHLAYPLRLLYLFLALFQNIILGAILTFAISPVYSYYQDAPGHWGISPGMDQQLGGIIMWIPGAMMYFAALSILFFTWIERDEREVVRRLADEERRGRYLERARARGAVSWNKD